jgi:hypothetical protein
MLLNPGKTGVPLDNNPHFPGLGPLLEALSSHLRPLEGGADGLVGRVRLLHDVCHDKVWNFSRSPEIWMKFEHRTRVRTVTHSLQHHLSMIGHFLAEHLLTGIFIFQFQFQALQTLNVFFTVVCNQD